MTVAEHEDCAHGLIYWLHVVAVVKVSQEIELHLLTDLEGQLLHLGDVLPVLEVCRERGRRKK
jgi:hypothetical protein